MNKSMVIVMVISCAHLAPSLGTVYPMSWQIQNLTAGYSPNMSQPIGVANPIADHGENPVSTRDSSTPREFESCQIVVLWEVGCPWLPQKGAFIHPKIGASHPASSICHIHEACELTRQFAKFG